MNNSALFRKAHKLAKSIIKQGDNYAVTFGACLKFLRSQYPKLDFQWIKRMLTSSKEMFVEACYEKRVSTKLSMIEDSEMFELHAFAEILKDVADIDTIKSWYTDSNMNIAICKLRSICKGLDADDHFSLPFYNQVVAMIK